MHGSSFALSVAGVKVVRHTPQMSRYGKLWKNEWEHSAQDTVCQHYCLPGSRLRKSPLLCRKGRGKNGHPRAHLFGRRLCMRLSQQIGIHCLPLGMNGERTVAELSEDGVRAPVPTRPGKRGVAVHVFCVDSCPGIQKKLNRLITAESGSTMQGSLALGTTISHEGASFNGWFCGAVRIGAAGEQDLGN